ncbi:LemA family protein [Verrucomicrobia bacterium]|nr:LemA family protein [Verrucomicrobiota bacterium]
MKSPKVRYYLGCFVLGTVFVLTGFWVQGFGFDIIRDMRQMERVPQVSVHHVIPGEVSMQGVASKGKQTLVSRYTNTPCLYHRYLKQHEEKDSDGDSRWVTVEEGSESTDFFLVENTGKILVELNWGGVSPDLETDYRSEKGRYRYTEWRIEEGEGVFAFAMAVKKQNGFSLRFDKSGSYSPVLSNADALENRSGLGTNGVLASMASVALLCFGCLSLCFALRIHRVLVFLSIVSALTSSAMIYSGLSMMKADLKDGYARLDRLEKSAQSEVTDLVDVRVDWKTLPSHVVSLNESDRDRIMGIREDFVASVERTEAIRNRFPERLLAPLWGVEARPSLLADGEVMLDEAVIAKTPMKSWIFLLCAAVALLMMCFGSWFGFRRIKTKRYVENIPTSPSAGLTYGPAEIKGIVECDQDRVLKGPLSGEKCIFYRYKITERRGSGKKAKTVVILDEKHFVPFQCRDSEGVISIEPEGAEFTADLKVQKRRGRQTHYEWHIAPSTAVYALGSAVVDKEKGDRLVISDGDNDGFPFLVSDETETEVMLRQGRKGLLGISFAQNGTVFLGLVLFAALGSFAATDFLLSALISPLFLGFSMFVLMFNDLVFLRNRVKRAWANIEVSLKKRADLIPRLENIVQGYLSHEKVSLEALTGLRTAVVGKNSYSPTDVDLAMQQETALTNRLFALREESPDLKGDSAMDEFMDRLTRMENEVALMRKGYNDGIERYHATKQRIPEVFLAKFFKFQDAEFLGFSKEIRKVPSFTFDENVSQEDNSVEAPLIQGEPVMDSFSSSQSVYVFKDEQVMGPYTVDQLKVFVENGDFLQNDQACFDGKNWVTVAEVPGFAE